MNLEVAAAQPTVDEQSSSTRTFPMAAWVLLGFATLIVVRTVTHSNFAPFSTFAVIGPLLLAAAVMFVATPNRRIRLIAILLAVPPVVSIAGAWIVDAVPNLAPGVGVDTVLILLQAGDVARVGASLIGLAGLVWLALTIGGVRTFMSALVIGFGALLSAANVLWVVNANLGLGLDVLLQTVGLSVLYALCYSFAFAAALESLRNFLWIGFGLIFASVAISTALLWLAPGPGNASDFSVLVGSATAAVGWAFIVGAVLRGELNDPVRSPSRSRAGRGSSSRQTAG